MQVHRISLSRYRWLSFRSRSAIAVSCVVFAALPVSAQTLDRIAESGRIRLGYLDDAAPFTQQTRGGGVEGYLAGLCEQIAEHARVELGLAALALDWVPVTVGDRLRGVEQGRIDLLCAPTNVTLTRRGQVSFSIPVFLGGDRAILRQDAPPELRGVLAGARPTRPVWRGKPAATVLREQVFAVVAGSTTESWLAERLSTFHVDAQVVPAPDYRTALRGLEDGSIDVFFGERALAVEAMHELGLTSFVILDRLFTQEQTALALSRDDADFRLLVDAALSEFYPSDAFAELYIQWFGDLDESTRAFFELNALPN